MTKFKTVNYSITFDIALPKDHEASINNDIAHAAAKAVREVLENYHVTHAGIMTSYGENDD